MDKPKRDTGNQDATLPPVGDGLKKKVLKADRLVRMRVKAEAGREMQGMNARLQTQEAASRNHKLNKRVMSKSNVKKEGHGDGEDFIKQQSAIDEAKNERMRVERNESKLDPAQVNRRKNREYKPGVDVKKTGGGKH